MSQTSTPRPPGSSPAPPGRGPSKHGKPRPDFDIARALRARLWPITFALALGVTPARAQILDTRLWATDGDVYAIVRDGSTIYVGGHFTRVGQAIGGGVLLSAESSGMVQPFPKVVGTVYAATPDGSGGWYIGGRFSHVGGLPRSNVARILADGSVSSWDPNADQKVSALAVSGSTVYAGGSFTRIGGLARRYIAALDASSGTATAWNPNANDGINALAVSGGTVYAGGWFSTIGGQLRNCIAALDAATGAATAWNPNPQYPPLGGLSVSALAVSGNVVYAGGAFGYIGGQVRANLAALDATTGNATDWNPNLSGLDGGVGVHALALDGNIVYVGGGFRTIGGQPRRHLAALDAATAAATPWDPNPGGYIEALAVSGSTVYAGGLYEGIGGQARKNVAALDAATGVATDAWDLNPDQSVSTLAASGTRVYVGGSFNISGGAARSNIAALDAATGAATAWNPDANDIVHVLTVNGPTIYAGGRFAAIGGQARHYIAALDAATGAPTAWDPNADGIVDVLAVSGATVYACGSFTSIGGQARYRIAALDAATGAATAWNPNPNGRIVDLAVDGGTIYVGGSFTTIGGQARNFIAALDAATGAATAWDPNASGGVGALAVSGGTVYASGGFTTIGGQARNKIAALDAATGAATAWNPGVNSPVVLSLAVSGGTVYASGSFTSIGGQPRNNIAALDALTGAATAWDPKPIPGNAVLALWVSGGTLYAGGQFYGMSGQPQSHLAAMTTSEGPTATLLAMFDAVVVSDGVLLRWQLGAPAAADAVSVERAERESGPWMALPLAPSMRDGIAEATDRSAAPGRPYWYRLVASLRDGGTTTFGPIKAELPGHVAASGVTGLWPNPSTGLTHVEYAVARREMVRLSVLDVAGREVEVLAQGSMPPGRYSAVWDGQRGRAAPGIYYLLWMSPGRSTSHRLAILR